MESNDMIGSFISAKTRNRISKFCRILLCIFSVSAIVMIEDNELSVQLINQKGNALYIHAAFTLMAILFLQYQFYNYLIPQSLRSKDSYREESRYNASFFKGTIGFGYILFFFTFFRTFYV